MQFNSAKRLKNILKVLHLATSPMVGKSMSPLMEQIVWSSAPTTGQSRAKWFSSARSAMVRLWLNFTGLASKNNRQRKTKPGRNKKPSLEHNRQPSKGNFNKNVKTLQRCKTSIKLPTMAKPGQTRLLQVYSIQSRPNCLTLPFGLSFLRTSLLLG